MSAMRCAGSNRDRMCQMERGFRPGLALPFPSICLTLCQHAHTHFHSTCTPCATLDLRRGEDKRIVSAVNIVSLIMQGHVRRGTMEQVLLPHCSHQSMCVQPAFHSFPSRLYLSSCYSHTQQAHTLRSPLSLQMLTNQRLKVRITRARLALCITIRHFFVDSPPRSSAAAAADTAPSSPAHRLSVTRGRTTAPGTSTSAATGIPSTQSSRLDGGRSGREQHVRRQSKRKEKQE